MTGAAMMLWWTSYVFAMCAVAPARTVAQDVVRPALRLVKR